MANAANENQIEILRANENLIENLIENQNLRSWEDETSHLDEARCAEKR